MGWESRPRLRSRHEFPVDLDTYEPLSGAIEKLSESLTAYDRGYFAVIGPPGSGKSTLLSQVLSSRGDRIVRLLRLRSRHSASANTSIRPWIPS